MLMKISWAHQAITHLWAARNSNSFIKWLITRPLHLISSELLKSSTKLTSSCSYYYLLTRNLRRAERAMIVDRERMLISNSNRLIQRSTINRNSYIHSLKMMELLSSSGPLTSVPSNLKTPSLTCTKIESQWLVDNSKIYLPRHSFS